jgi:hypothetical protein
MTETAIQASLPEKKWYVVHTYSGYEQKAKAALEERVRSLHMEEKIGEILVPVERVQELGKGGQRNRFRRTFHQPSRSSRLRSPGDEGADGGRGAASQAQGAV